MSPPPAIAVLAFVTLAFSACGRPRPGEVPATRAERVESAVLKEIGVFEPAVIARILSPIQGTLAEVIEDGTSVKAGDLLFRIDDEEILSRIESQNEALEQRREELESLRSQLEVLVETYGFIHRKEEAEQVHAALELERRMQGLTAEERRQLEIDVELAALDLEDRRDRLARQRELVARQFAPVSTLEVMQRETEAAETTLEERRLQLQLAIAPLADEERVTLEAALARATDVVERSRRRHERERQMLELRIRGLELEIANLEEDLARLRDESSRARVLSPADGVIRVTRRFSWSARVWQTLSPGQQIWGANTLGELVNPSELTLRVLVHESDAARVRPGQRARARILAYPDREVQGAVRSVSALGQDRSDLSPIYRQAPPAGQAFFLAEINLDTRGIPALPGMTASVVIETEASP